VFALETRAIPARQTRQSFRVEHAIWRKRFFALEPFGFALNFAMRAYISISSRMATRCEPMRNFERCGMFAPSALKLEDWLEHALAEKCFSNNNIRSEILQARN
jgi:hypothetical protein